MSLSKIALSIAGLLIVFAGMTAIYRGAMQYLYLTP
jgi:hypothetical protein